MKPTVTRQENRYILRDESILPGARPEHFDDGWWCARSKVRRTAAGRGTVHFVDGCDGIWVLRRYLRGGWMEAIGGDRYLWLGLAATRPWREWHLLSRLHKAGLPVPEPVAAYVERSAVIYRGSIITRSIEDAETIADLLGRMSLTENDWTAIGRLIRQLHAQGVWHADINARNILRTPDGKFHLVDFDKARIARHGSWMPKQLARLRRSLEKHARRHASFHFRPSDWVILEQAYRGAAD